MKPETVWLDESFHCEGWRGEMASRIARFDWSETAMGPIDRWSRSLRAAVQLMLASPVPLVMLWGRPGTMIYNDAYAGFAGGRHPFLLGKPVEEGWPEIAAFNRNVVDTCVSGATLSYADKRLTLHRNGQPEDVWMDLHYSPVAEDDGHPAGVIAIVLETTGKVLAERHRDTAERAFREANERLNLALSSGIVLGTWVWDPASGRISGDERFVKALGLQGRTDESWLFETLADSLHPEDAERVRASMNRALDDVDGRHEIEFRVRAPEGHYRWALSSGRCEFDGLNKPVRLPGVLVDIHERKIAEDKLLKLTQTLEERVAEAVTARVEAEERLRQVQKLEAIGNLTGGVAHDFNNVLQIISANLQLIGLATRDKPDLTRRLHVMSEAVARGGKLASQMLAFARRQPLNPAVVNPAKLVADICEFLQRALPESIKLTTSVSGEAWNLFVDRHQLENALLNLVINSRDAIHEGGNIWLEVANVSNDDGHATGLALPAGDYVRLAVTDDGAGMPDSVKARMFEPFYSTKAEGQGTGLGLSMVFGFVSQSSGCVDVQTQVGKGTTVALYFPRCWQAEAASADGARPRASRGGEVVLVVEDDADVRLSTIDMLAQLGYKVLSAQDADSALAVLQTNRDIDLLFSDVVMPGTIRANDLAKIASAPPYNATVVFASGYTRDIIFHEGRLNEGVVLLKKPFTFDDLARTIRHALDARR
ncbi:PAS/PAC sensor hybrid histidine kinase [Caballeronia catudaia]|uniref:histidine kinase n=1 Tax=Caballeronia catudaia TaxID=1777136 RepID=A0A158CW72_9BURK|nr:ATP-binding protein [Caballeronia catudaia]SAK85837.1 PAS/PAC sensor hybrid histidine kinase [Caballeronia catudaia]